MENELLRRVWRRVSAKLETLQVEERQLRAWLRMAQGAQDVGSGEVESELPLSNIGGLVWRPVGQSSNDIESADDEAPRAREALLAIPSEVGSCHLGTGLSTNGALTDSVIRDGWPLTTQGMSHFLPSNYDPHAGQPSRETGHDGSDRHEESHDVDSDMDSIRDEDDAQVRLRQFVAAQRDLPPRSVTADSHAEMEALRAAQDNLLDQLGADSAWSAEAEPSWQCTVPPG